MRDERPRPGSLVAAGTGVIAVTYGLIRFGYGLHLPVFTREFGLPPAMAGAIAAASFAAYCGAALLAERLTGLGRPRRTLWVAGALAGGGALAVAAAWSPGGLAVAVLVAGSAAGAASPALVAAVGHTVHPTARDRAQAVVNSGTGVGVVVGGLLVATSGERWRALWIVYAALAVLITWWADRRTAWPAGAAVPPARSALRPWSDLTVLRTPLLAALLAGAGSAAVWTFGRDLLAAGGGISSATTALLWCLLGGAGMLGAFSGDVVHRLGARIAWIATAVVMAAGTAVLGLVPGVVPVAAVALAAFGGSYVALSGVLIAWAGRATPDRAAGSTAILFIALTAGQAVGAAALGAIAGLLSSLAGFLVAAALILLSCSAVLRPAAAGTSARLDSRSTRRPTPGLRSVRAAAQRKLPAVAGPAGGRRPPGMAADPRGGGASGAGTR